MKPLDSDKENQNVNLHSETKMKISQYLDDQEELNSKDEIEVPTNQSTYRAFEPESINE